MASYEGGMEIEQLAEERPDALAKVPIDAAVGVDEAKAREIAVAAKFPGDLVPPVADILVKLWDTFVAEDATLVEVNPLARVADGSVVALDGKVTLDANADFRQAEHAAFEDKDAADPPARGEGQGEAPQLRQARWAGGRHHRQRRRPGDVDAGRRRLRR